MTPWHTLHRHLTRWCTLGSLSLRAQLLWGILCPVGVVLLINTAVLYQQALRAANTAYDRTLLASAKAIGEQLQVIGDGEQARLHAALLYSSLEPFEADNRSRLFYRVSGFDGQMVSGFPDLPLWRGELPLETTYAALVDFYDDRYQDLPVRVAVLLQPVASATGMGMATIQVAETLELRETLARQLLLGTIWRQLALLGVIAALVIWVVQRATRPVRDVGTALRLRSDSDLSPLPTTNAPKELRPVLDATNQHMARLSHLLAHQKRFVRDTSHQLRTPLAVLKAQVQSARRGDVSAAQALAEIEHTVDDATLLANQMLALAKAEQLHAQGVQADTPATDWAAVVRQVALDMSPLIVAASLDFELHLPNDPVCIRAHDWALRELTRNLLHNALRHSPQGAALRVSVWGHATSHQHVPIHQALLLVADEGPGIPESLRPHLFQPFAKGRPDDGQGSGLGLAICHGLVLALGGGLSLDNRDAHGRVHGLDAKVWLPLCRAVGDEACFSGSATSSTESQRPTQK